jgi:hypothetical protein
MIEHGFMVAAEVEFLALFALDLLPQSVKRHPADEVGRELTRTLFRPDDLTQRLAF